MRKCIDGQLQQSSTVLLLTQLPAADQPFPLPVARQRSTIPKAGTEESWVYPSQQMFYNALRYLTGFAQSSVLVLELRV